MLLTLRQAQDITGRSEKNLRSKVKSGIIPATVINRKYMVDEKDLLPHMKKSKSQNTVNNEETVNNTSRNPEQVPSVVNLNLSPQFTDKQIEDVRASGRPVKIVTRSIPGGVEQDFISSTSEQADSKNADYTTLSFNEGFAILMVLIALFFALHFMQQQKALEEAQAKAEKELKETGLEKEDLKQHKGKSIIMLQKHPKNARRMRQIAEDAVLQDIA